MASVRWALILKNLTFVAIVPGTIAAYVPYLLTRNRVIESDFAILCAGLLFVAGLGMLAWCIWDFAVFGRGTPAPVDAPKRLVVRGLYRYMRNPMYIGVLTIIGGWAILYRSVAVLTYLVVVALGFHLMIVLFEEPRLKQLFGDEYAFYRARVRRWMPWPGRRQDRP